jgi:hypothetical protein
MNARIVFNIFWLLGFATVIFGAIYRSRNTDVGNGIVFAGMGLTVIATAIRLRFLKKR